MLKCKKILACLVHKAPFNVLPKCPKVASLYMHSRVRKCPEQCQTCSNAWKISTHSWVDINTMWFGGFETINPQPYSGTAGPAGGIFFPRSCICFGNFFGHDPSKILLPRLVYVRGTCSTYARKNNFVKRFPWRWVREISTNTKKMPFCIFLREDAMEAYFWMWIIFFTEDIL